MSDCMIIRLEGDLRHFWTCAGKHCQPGPVDEKITEFLSEAHAHETGWRYTYDVNYCEPGKVGVWICPSCVEAAQEVPA